MQDLVGIILAFVPIIAILLLANVAEGQRERGEPSTAMSAFAYTLLVCLYGTGILIGLGLHLTGLILAQQPSLLAEFAGDFGQSLFENHWLLAAGIWVPSLIGIILLLKPVRSGIARFIPIDEGSPVDAVALSLSMLIVINLMVTLGVGLANLADLLEADKGDEGYSTMALLWVQQLMMAFTAAVGVGWFTRRRWRGARQRLGIVMPSLLQVVSGILIGGGLVLAVLVLEYVASLAGVQADADVERLTEELLGSLFGSPIGIITLGVAAAVGEEPLFRGAAQPKFGIVVTALMFSLVHSNYGITLSTAIVFFLGIVLGLIRVRANTSTAMITHAAYNIGLGLLAIVGASFLEP